VASCVDSKVRRDVFLLLSHQVSAFKKRQSGIIESRKAATAEEKPELYLSISGKVCRQAWTSAQWWLLDTQCIDCSTL